MTQRLQRLTVFSVACIALLAAAFFYVSYTATHRANSKKMQTASDKRQSANTTRDPHMSRLTQSLGQLPLSFEENRGQFDSRVKFLTRGAGYGLFLSSGQATIVHHGKAHITDGGDASSLIATLGSSNVPTKSVTQLTWIGANPNAQPRGTGRQAGESNYLIGKDPRKWRRHVQHYDRVQLAGLYPGIDLVYHGVQQQVELDYVIAPHADPKTIQVGISGPSLVSVDASGQLSISSGGDELLLLPPTAYQEKDGRREIVQARYVLAASHQVGFELGAYDHSRPLVIDPVLTFAADFGTGSNSSILTDVVLDSTGNIYVTGTTCDTNYPTTIGAYQPSGGSNVADACNDVIVTKLNPTASELLYSTYIGGQTNVDFGSRLLVDSAGEATVVGTTASSDFPTTSGAYQTILKSGTCNYSPNLTNQSCSDAFLLKLSADGSSLVYSTLFGGERVEIAMGLVQDSSGNSYISGATNSALLPVNSSSYSSTYGGAGDCQNSQVPCFDGFIAKISPNGSQLLASTYLGGEDDDFAAGVALDTSGNVYVTGSADSTNFPTTAGAYQTTHANSAVDNRDAYLAKFDSNLHTLQYSTFLGGSDDDISFNLRVDSSGAAYITGSTLSPDFPTTAGAYQTTYNGPSASTTNCGSTLDDGVLSQPTCGDVFLAKINPSNTGAAQLVFSTYLGGSNNNFAYNLALDSQNDVWLIGDTNSSNFPTTPDAYYSEPSSSPLFLSEIKNDGTQLLFSTLLSQVPSDDALGLGITIDSSNDVFVAGQGTVSPTPGTYNTGSNLFVMEFSPGTARPGVSLSATQLTFGNPPTNPLVPLNSASPPQSVTLTNSGTGTLQLAISLTAGTGNSLVFSEYDNCGTSVAAGATCTINAIYEPSSASSNQSGSDGATIYIQDNAPGAPHSIALNGNSRLLESTSFVPATLTFNGQGPGSASAAQTSYLNSSTPTTNSTSAYTTGPAVVSGPNASDFSVNTSSCPAGGEGCGLSVTFAPAANATGTRTATVTVPTNAPNSPETLSLTGNVSTGPFAVFSPPYVNPTVVGQTLNTSLVLTNTGGSTLTVTGVTPSGADPGDFVLSNESGCSGYPSFSVASQGTCLLNLAFTPGAVGTRTATFTLVDNEATHAALAVSGYGASNGGPELTLVTTPSLINNQILYPDTVVGHTATYNIAIITVLNVGSTGSGSNLHITNFSLTGDFTQTNNCPSPTTAIGSGCTYTVIFAPTAQGLRTGTLTIATDAPGGQTLTVNFAGNGVLIPSATVTPPSINFGSQESGTTSAAQSVTVTNSGNGTLNLSNVSLSGPFTVTTTPAPCTTLAAGANCTYAFKFAPTAAGSASGTLTATTNAAGGLLAIGLNGTGVTGPVPIAQPTSLNFGPQPILTKSAPQTVTLSNVGDTAFTIAGVRASENFSETNTCPASLAANASCTISVSFAPTNDTFTASTPPYFPTQGNIFVTIGAPGSPFSIPVVGDAIPSTGAATNLVITSSQNPSTVGQSVTFTATVTPTSGTGTPTGTVTFFGGGGSTQLGPAVTLNSQAQATFTTTSLPAGFNSITIDYSGDTTFAPENSSGFVQTVNAAVTNSGDFSVAASPSSATVSAGQATAYTLTISPLSGFNQAVTISCSGAPAQATCVPAQTSVTLNGTSSTQVQVNVATTARAAGVVPASSRRRYPPTAPFALLAISLSWLAAIYLWRHLTQKTVRLGYVLASWIFVFAAICGCGSGSEGNSGGGNGNGSGSSGTPAGTYTLTLSGTSGSLNHTATVTLNVN